MILKFNDFKKVNENVLANSTNVALMDSLDIEDKYKSIIGSIIANSNITNETLLKAGVNTIIKYLKTNNRTISPDLKMEEVLNMLINSNNGGLLNVIETAIGLVDYGVDNYNIINTQKSTMINNINYRVGYIGIGGGNEDNNLYFNLSTTEAMIYKKGITTIYWIYSPFNTGNYAGYSLLVRHTDGSNEVEYAYDTTEMGEQQDEITQKYELEDLPNVEPDNIKLAYDEMSAMFNDRNVYKQNLTVELNKKDEFINYDAYKKRK
jgi:hypothetical protein